MEVGSRICTEDGHYATVLYVGSVQGTKGEWLGVEWDDSDRGKHDGEHEGVRYFTTTPGRGSFIRPKKVQPSFGFFRKLADRYGLQGPDAGVSTEQLYVGDGLGQITKVEMIGAEKVNKLQSNFRGLEIVVLRGSAIHGLETDVDLNSLVPNIKELNLSRNLFSSWEQIARIAAYLPRLRTLNLSDNRLRSPVSNEKLAASFENVKVLFLNSMALDFETVLCWSEMWRGLQDLHICFNRMDKLCNPGDNLRHLKLLNLEGNRFDLFEDLLVLQHLPQLQTLIVNNTGLKTVNLRMMDSENGFKRLTKLSLCNNAIADWPSIDELNRLTLLDLKLSGTPLWSSDKWESVRELVIGKMAALKLLNRTDVTEEERRGAELCYLKNFGQDWLKAGGHGDPEKNKPNQEFQELHPRFQPLVVKYGPPEVSEMYKAPQGLKDNLIQIHIRGPGKEITKRVPKNMAVQKLKTMVKKLLKADIATLVLTDVGQGEALGKWDNKVELDNDLRDLNFYSVIDGDVVEAVWS